MGSDIFKPLFTINNNYLWNAEGRGHSLDNGNTSLCKK